MITLKGVLGWSNKRIGLELYQYDPDKILRHDSEWGDLLVRDIPSSLEGCSVILIITDRDTTPEELDELRNGIASQIVMEN